ncbi:FG-GAP-like repeat-containing protein [Micromonospora sp. NPDC018662]|uniref:FG-GAP-like repeat-containing protein n=1 Tax=Micromonospora sp. NPDC018662 TaxID=3364238 RepID=UPI0037B87C54
MSAVVVVAALAAATPAQAVSGGTAVPDGAYPYLTKVAVGGPDPRACTGALVDPGWVVTARSCFEAAGPLTGAGAPANPTTATIGRTDLTGTAGVVVPVTRLVPHPTRNVVMARLATPVPDITPVRIGGAAPAVGDVLRLLGYGRTGTVWVPDRPHSTTVEVTGVSATTVAVQGQSGQADPCKGDAGGPALREAAGQAELVAVHDTSWQHGCLGVTETRQGAVEARLDDLAGWVRATLLDPAADPLPKHAIDLRWQPLAGATTYEIYGSTTAGFPADAANLLASIPGTTFRHQALPGRQKWYYRIVPVDSTGARGEPSAEFSATTAVSPVSDFDADGKDDVVAFAQGALKEVNVALSTGTGFGTPALWKSNFSYDGEIPAVGDVNGDGKTDAITFTQGTSKAVYVAPSTGSGFGAAVLWKSNFSYDGEVPAVGDVNGDGRDDAVTFTQGTTRTVQVALSTGTAFGAAAPWKTNFSYPGEKPALGDVNGDGMADAITFTQGASKAVHVALSTGSGFGAAVLWKSNFSYDGEVPAVGDVNGDGRDDAVTFTQGTTRTVQVALSTGTAFGVTAPWKTNFSYPGEIPGVADFNGDGRDDVVSFSRGSAADVWVARSTGTGFGTAEKWQDVFAPGVQVPAPRAQLVTD